MPVTYVKVKDYADERKLHRETVYDSIKRGELKFIRIGRALRIVLEEPASAAQPAQVAT